MNTVADIKTPFQAVEAPDLWSRIAPWLGILPPSRPKPVTKRQIREIYRRPQSFADFLPFVEYDPASQCILFADGVSVGCLFEVRPIDAAGRPPARVEETLARIETAFNVIPERDADPWILQLYVQDEPLLALDHEIRAYVAQVDASRRFSAPHLDRQRDTYLEAMTRHVALAGRSAGMFQDTASGVRWGGRYRRVRLCLYRQFERKPWPNRYGQYPADELNDVARRLATGLAAAELAARRCDGRDLFQWMFPWFSPQPYGQDPYALLRTMPYPSSEEEQPYGFDLGTMVMSAQPRSSGEEGIWYFGGLAHRILSVDHLSLSPAPGVFTLERRNLGESSSPALLDQLPSGSVLAMTVVFTPQDLVRDHLERIRRRSAGDRQEAAMSHDDTSAAIAAVARGRRLFQCDAALYLRAENARALDNATIGASAILASRGINTIEPSRDLVATDSYVRHLPFVYQPSFDPYLRRARLQWARDIAALSPLFGQGVGTGRPGTVFFNRAGEPLMFDLLADKQRTADLLVFGPKGSGKSALLNYLLLSTLAVHRPYLVIIDVGQSFRLFGEYLKTQGLSVHYVELSPQGDVSIPPFVEAIKLIDDHGRFRETVGDRDLLGEMVIAARLMIQQERGNMAPHDLKLLGDAIKLAAQLTYQDPARYPQVMTDQVIMALRHLAGGGKTVDGHELDPSRRPRAAEFAEAMGHFASGFAARIFNRPGQPWPEADVTIVELGTLGRQGYEAIRAIASIGLINHLNDQLERRQASGRQTILVKDEAHVTTTHPLLAPYLASVSKMWRKLGCWLWLATQNLSDFEAEAAKILNNAEWWILLSMPKQEIAQVERFRQLTDEHRAMIASAHKEAGKYVEGVILSDYEPALIRNVPPAIALALAQTDADEKAARRQIMEARHCSELEAALAIAEEIERRRAEG